MKKRPYESASYDITWFNTYGTMITTSTVDRENSYESSDTIWKDYGDDFDDFDD